MITVCEFMSPVMSSDLGDRMWTLDIHCINQTWQHDFWVNCGRRIRYQMSFSLFVSFYLRSPPHEKLGNNTQAFLTAYFILLPLKTWRSRLVIPHDSHENICRLCFSKEKNRKFSTFRVKYVCFMWDSCIIHNFWWNMRTERFSMRP